MVGVTDNVGVLTAETRYMPFGEVRSDVGTIAGTDYGYTFQRMVADTGLMDYKARAYDPWLGRFVQPDTIIPAEGNSQAYNRYVYSHNNPIVFCDPSGHQPCIFWDSRGECVTSMTNYLYNKISSHNTDISTDRHNIWEWSEEKQEKFPESTDPRCTIFISTGAHEGAGWDLTDDWAPGMYNWKNANGWYSHVNEKFFVTNYELNIVPINGVMMSTEDINFWFEYHEIPEGSWVFYDIDNADYEFSHVGVLGPSTIEYYGITAPEMIDMDGSGSIDGKRSLFDTPTFNTNMDNPSEMSPYRIVIVVIN